MNPEKSRSRDDRGAVIIWVAVLMVVFMAFTALAVDIGYLMVTRNELQNVADAAALAGTRVLGLQYEGLTYAQQQNVTADSAAILAAVSEVATQNEAAGVNISIATDDVTIGSWDGTTKTLSGPLLLQANAVRVVARRSSAVNGPVSTFFAGIFGQDSAEVSAMATAALTGQSTVAEGGLPVPFAISSEWWTFSSCNQPIKFYPTGSTEGCAGWHTFDLNANASNLDNIINGLIGGTYLSPETVIGSELEAIGGNVASALPDLKALYEANKDPAGQWTVSVPVYDMADYPSCSNPNQELKIVGFATATITNVLAPPDGQLIEAIVVCDAVDPGRGSGGNFGTMGSIPGLVE
jgi:Flp pilus assembly protein TadG